MVFLSNAVEGEKKWMDTKYMGELFLFLSFFSF